MSSTATSPVAPPGWILPCRTLLAADARGSDMGDVQLTCHAGPYALDIFLRADNAAEKVEIVGLVAIADRAFEPVQHLALSLVDADGRLLTPDTRTDTFGEFDFSSPTAETLGLRVGSHANAPSVLLWGNDS